MRPLIGAVAASAMFIAGTAALAQGVTFKTPPLQASDIVQLGIGVPTGPQPPWAGWAGGIMTMHIADNTEMDVLGIGPAPGMSAPIILNPFGPASSNSMSVVKTFTAWHPTAPNSGDNVSSDFRPLLGVEIHVKNSNPSGNSDIDATFGLWNIWHIREGGGSTLVHLDPSALILVTSNIPNITALHINNPGSPFFSLFRFPTNPATPNDPNAHWLHITEPVNFHLDPGFGSQYYATFIGTQFLGIEHVPEPTGIVLLASGAVCTVFGTWFRRRRRKLAA